MHPRPPFGFHRTDNKPSIAGNKNDGEPWEHARRARRAATHPASSGCVLRSRPARDDSGARGAATRRFACDRSTSRANRVAVSPACASRSARSVRRLTVRQAALDVCNPRPRVARRCYCFVMRSKPEASHRPADRRDTARRRPPQTLPRVWITKRRQHEPDAFGTMAAAPARAARNAGRRPQRIPAPP